MDILIADDHELFRRGLRNLLESHTEWHVCGEASDGREAVEKACALDPDVILLDVSMPEMNGLDAARLIRKRSPRSQILMISQNDPALIAKTALEAGAKGFIQKSRISQDLAKAIQAISGDSLDPAPLGIPFEGNAPAPVENESDMHAQARGLLAAIVDSSDDAVISKNLKGTITSWNKSAERMFGYAASEAIGKHIKLIIPPERWSEEDEILRKLGRGERVEHFETIRVRKDGSLLELSLTISPVRDSTGKVIGASKVARDVSERKRTERQLQENQERLKAEAELLRKSEERFRELSERLDHEVRVRTAELEERNAEVLRQSEQLRELSWHLLRVQDDERRRIARELHDSAGQMLAVLGMNLSSLSEMALSTAPDFAERAESCQELIRRLQQEIRTTSYLLHPPLLEEAVLAAALDWYVDGLHARSGLEISLDVSEDLERLPDNLELVVFRIVQEALTNVHRHSGGNTGAICISRQGKNVIVEIKDNGRGIEPTKLAEIQTRGSGVGIRGMRERIKQFQGSLDIQSDRSGTRIVATIPIPANPEREVELSLSTMRSSA